MTTITTIITNIEKVINLLVPLVFAIAFVVFIFGVFRYFILGGANEEKRAQGRQLIMWGLIAFFVMVSVWGLVNLITNTLNLDSSSKPCLPTFTGPCANGSGSATTQTTPVPVVNTPPAHFIGPIDPP
ncbi:MAG: pilin [Candidatus Paceibacterota bacterium]